MLAYLVQVAEHQCCPSQLREQVNVEKLTPSFTQVTKIPFLPPPPAPLAQLCFSQKEGSIRLQRGGAAKAQTQSGCMNDGRWAGKHAALAAAAATPMLF